MKPESSKDVWVAAVPSMNSGRREDGESLTSVTQSYQGVLSRVESGDAQPVACSWSADAQPTFPFTVICVTQGVGETLTSTDNACVHANQLPTGFVTVMLSCGRSAICGVGGNDDSAAALKVTATPKTSAVVPARGPAEGGAVTWISGSNLHETVRSADSWVPRCSFVDTSGSALRVRVVGAHLVRDPVRGHDLERRSSDSGRKQSRGQGEWAKVRVHGQHVGVSTLHLSAPRSGVRRARAWFFKLGGNVAATSMTSCRFGTIVVNGWMPLVTTDTNADAGIVCVSPAMRRGPAVWDWERLEGAVGDSTTSKVTLGTMPYIVYSEY